VHALIAEQDEAVVTALRDQSGSPDVAVVPMLPEEPVSERGIPQPADSDTRASRAPEGATVAGARRERRRPRRALTAVLAAGALAVGGTAAALVTTSSGGSPTAASPPISSSAAAPEAGAGTSSDSANSSDSAAQSASDAPTPAPATDGMSPTDGTSPSDGASSTTDLPSTLPSKTSPSTGPVCLGVEEALALANQKNRGSLPADAKVSALKCDGTWAGAQLTSATMGDVEALYEYQSGAWKAADLGSILCDGVAITKAPSDIRKFVNC
jgi:hypothetical protein